MRSNRIRSGWALAAPSAAATAQPLPEPGWHQALRDLPRQAPCWPSMKPTPTASGPAPSRLGDDMTRHLNAYSELLGGVRNPFSPGRRPYPAACSQEHQRLLA